MSNAGEAFGMLGAIADGALDHALPLPAQEQAAQTWRGLAFNVGANRLLSELGEVVEVIEVPAMTRIPGTAPAVMGLANVRGRLLPVVDLCSYLEFENTTPSEDWRVLVLEDGDLFCGLLVEQSFGMMQFEVDDHDADEDVSLGNRLDPYLRGSFRQGGRQWRVLGLRALVREPAFFEVAA